MILTKRYALKIPSPRCWRDFLFGLLNNMNEARLGRAGNNACCPVLFALWGGFLIVMPRVEVLSDEEFARLDLSAFSSVRVEPKPDSFGRLGGAVVAIDYGW